MTWKYSDICVTALDMSFIRLLHQGNSVFANADRLAVSIAVL